MHVSNLPLVHVPSMFAAPYPTNLWATAASADLPLGAWRTVVKPIIDLRLTVDSWRLLAACLMVFATVQLHLRTPVRITLYCITLREPHFAAQSNPKTHETFDVPLNEGELPGGSIGRPGP